jgi:hypothetical protein
MGKIEFPYLKLLTSRKNVKPAQYIYRPVIPIELSFQDRMIRFDGLIDSGAGECSFPAWVAEALGHNLYKGTKKTFQGIGGTVVAYKHTTLIKLSVGDRFLSQVYYSKQWNHMPFGLLGQVGFFSYFNVGFDYKTKKISIKY